MSPTGVTQQASRDAYYHSIGELHLAPLWTRLHDLVTAEPSSACRPHLWRYGTVRPALLESGSVITAEEAERRVLVLENPGLTGTSRVTTSLYAGLQLVLPGEIAAAHRHTQSAIRFLLEGGGATTTVNGERTVLEFGDLVLTPASSWHDHGNDGSDPAVWLDGLDIPMVQLFDASFLDRQEQATQVRTVPDDHSLHQFGALTRPVEYRRTSLASPVVRYPYRRTRETLAALAAAGDPNPWHGHKIRYVNPVSGGDVLPTLAAFLQLLPAGTTTAGYRSTDAAVVVVAEGHGQSVVDGHVMEWGPRDILVIPSWATVEHRSSEDAVLFSYSDRAAQEKLGLWRDDRAGA